MGPVFEECSAQFLWREMGRGKYNFKTLGRWWGSNPKEKQEEEIDLLAIDEKGKAIFGECKWRRTRTGNDSLVDLIRKSELFPDYPQRQYIMLSKSGYTPQVIKTAAQRNDTALISLAEMF